MGFGGFHPGEREVISALLRRVPVARGGLEGLLLEPRRVVQLRHTWTLPQGGQAVRAGGDVREGGLLQRSHGRRRVGGVHLPAHVEAGRRAVAVVLPLRSLVGAGVLEHLRGVVVVFPIHGCRRPEGCGGRLRAHVP